MEGTDVTPQHKLSSYSSISVSELARERYAGHLSGDRQMVPVTSERSADCVYYRTHTVSTQPERIQSKKTQE